MADDDSNPLHSGNWPYVPPIHLYVEITTACNFRCPHCYNVAGEGSVRQLPNSLLHGLIDEFAAIGGQFVTFSGGEPTLYPGWPSALRYARYLGLNTVLLSNGALIKESDLDLLRDLDSHLALSLDGATAGVHDSIREAGAFDKVVRLLERLPPAFSAERVMLCFTPMAMNYRDLPGIVALAARHNVGSVYLSLLENRGRALRQEGRLELSDSEAAQLLYAIVSLPSRYPSVRIDCPNLRFFGERLNGLDLETDDLDYTIRVTATGDAYITAYLDADEFRLGDYVAGRLEELWYGERRLSAFRAAARRRRSLASCLECPASFCCRCGSAALAWVRNGSFDGVDLFCTAKRRLVDSLAYAP